MEIFDNSNTFLKLLKCTKYGITESVRRGSNLLTNNSDILDFVHHLEYIDTSNCLLPEKLVKHKVCQQNNFKFHSGVQISDSINFRPIQPDVIDCLEKDIKSSELVLMEKRKIIESLRSKLHEIEEGVIPTLEDKLRRENNSIEESLVNFFHLDDQLNKEHNIFDKNKQTLLQTLSHVDMRDNTFLKQVSPTSAHLYCLFDFKSNLLHSLQRLSTDFNIICKFLNSTVNRGSDQVGGTDYELEIEELSQCISQFRTNVELSNSLNYANKKCEEKFLNLLRQVKQKGFKFSTLEITSQSQINNLKYELTNLKSKLAAKHNEQITKIKTTALAEFYAIHLDQLNNTSQMLNQISTGVKYGICFEKLIFMLIESEKEKYDSLFEGMFDVFKKMLDLNQSMCTEENNLKQLLSDQCSTYRNPTESIVEQHGKRLIEKSLQVNIDGDFKAAFAEVEKRTRQEKQRLIQQYSIENIYKKLAPRRKRLMEQEEQIYSGPLNIPIFPHMTTNEEILHHQDKLLNIRFQLNNLLQRRPRELQGPHCMQQNGCENSNGQSFVTMVNIDSGNESR